MHYKLLGQRLQIGGARLSLTSGVLSGSGSAAWRPRSGCARCSARPRLAGGGCLRCARSRWSWARMGRRAPSASRRAQAELSPVAASKRYASAPRWHWIPSLPARLLAAMHRYQHSKPVAGQAGASSERVCLCLLQCGARWAQEQYADVRTRCKRTRSSMSSLPVRRAAASAQPPDPLGCRVSTAAHPARQVIAELSCLESLASLTLRGWTRGPVVTLAALAALRALTALQITFLEDGPVRRGTRCGWRPRLPRPTAACAHAPTAAGA